MSTTEERSEDGGGRAPVGLGPDQWLGIGAFVMLHAGILWWLRLQPATLLFVALLWATAAVLVYALKE